ncbi:MAG: hypothetical protein ACREII_02125 [Nitrospiraceae bacterium]
MPSRLPVTVALLLLLPLSPVLNEADAAGKVAGTLSLRDALTAPGRPVMIEARLVRAGFLGQTGLGGEQLEFIVEGKKAGTAMTGGDGRALFEYTPRRRGFYAVKVRLPQSQRVESSEASATVACWERRRPILLVEFAALTEDTKAPPGPLPSLPLELGRRDRPTPAPDAADELNRLTRFYYNVIYLVGGGDGDMGELGDVRAWLQDHKFPVGFSLTLQPGRTKLGPTIEDLRADGWDNLKAGVGRTLEFAEALAAQRMEVVIVPEPDRGELPNKAQVAKNWKDVRTKLHR